MSKSMKLTIEVLGTSISVLSQNDEDYISLTDMLKAKDGDFFIADWLRNRNTVEFLGIWERVHNPDFNYGEFAPSENRNPPRGSVTASSPPPSTRCAATVRGAAKSNIATSARSVVGMERRANTW